MTEITAVLLVAADWRSALRWGADILLYRLLRLVRLPGYNMPRTITVRGGFKLTYRMNRGDILTLREVWLDEVYRLPDDQSRVSVIDLGANIGLASVWFAAKYGCHDILAVEPVPDNATLLRHNLRQNALRATVVEGAVGAAQDQAFLALSTEPNSGRLAREGLPVETLTMDDVVRLLASKDVIDIVKIDIEGAEDVLFANDLRWLTRVQAVLVEIHAEVDVGRLVRNIEASGLRQVSPSTRVVDTNAGTVTTFARPASQS